MNNIVDIPHCLEQAAGNEALAKELFTMLLKELPDLQASLASAIEQQDLQACWDHAHKIYGSTAYCGVPGLRDSAQAMELAVKSNDIKRIQEQFTGLRGAIYKVLEAGPGYLQQSWLPG